MLSSKSRIKDLIGFLSLVSSLLGIFSALMDLTDVREKGPTLIYIAVQTAFYTGNIAISIFPAVFVFSMLSGIIYSAVSGRLRPRDKPTSGPDWPLMVGAVSGIGYGIYRGIYEPPSWGRVITILVGVGILALILYFAFRQFLKLSEGDDSGKSGSMS